MQTPLVPNDRFAAAEVWVPKRVEGKRREGPLAAVPGTQCWTG